MAKKWSAYFTDSYSPLEAGSIDRTDEIPHDRAISRALNSNYKPNRSVNGDPKCTLFVGRLSPETTEKTLVKEFSSYGRIQQVRIVRDIVTGFSKRYGFVEFEQEYQASRAYAKMNTCSIDGSHILVEFENERTMTGWVPRRLGGGLCGRKESGQLRFGGRDKPFKQPIFFQTQTVKEEPIDRSLDARDRKRKRSSSRDRDRYRRSGQSSSRSRHRHSRSRSRDRRSRRSRSRDRHRNRKERSRSRDRSRKNSPNSGRKLESGEITLKN